ncbi:ABC transporter permease [Chitinimonas sp. BJB300]|uniref:ABC transporter permease n=1 Tax=Chitinimonas sp. BJB300 TaxID=1559339 RepID=UPI000C0DAC8A|nr:FtsX-like permease family protein [Chitinimonas sp. BJB300]PHV10855.1 oxidoreductase [Chitinimonas sp. BJB300]TSJ83774.1 FtsX-like permease family protein [Chitinimonas sp. BJB300]
MSGWGLAWRWFKRDLAAGELTVMAVALVVAIAAMSSVGFFTDRVRQALQTEANQLLAADLVLNGDQPIADALRKEADRRGLQRAATATFPSMAQTHIGAQLITAKAVSSTYPLRGDLRVWRGEHEVVVNDPPKPGTAWADRRLFDALGLKQGDQLMLGSKTLQLTAVLAREPDGAMDLYNFIPRLMFNEADLPATGLIQPGSRVRYRLLLAGAPEAVSLMRDWLVPQIKRGQRLENVREARPEINASLNRSERFLRLSALVSVFMAAAAIALAARRYVERHLDAVALLRTLGRSQRDIIGLFMRQYALLALGSVVVGILFGWLVQFALAATLAGLFGAKLPAAGPLPALAGGGVGLTLLLGFCLPPLLRLRGVSPLRVLRRDATPPGNAPFVMLLGVASLAGLIAWQAGDAMLAGVALGGFAGTVGLAAMAAWGLVWLSPRLPLPANVGWRFGLANVARRRGLSVAQIVALSLGMMALMLLTVVRNDLLTAWDRSIPPDAPNRFAINIQPDQRTAISTSFREAGLSPPTFEPMVRARLNAIAGKPVRPETYKDEQQRRQVEREFNLSWGEDLRPDNRITAGKPLDDSQPGWSLEEGMAKRLEVKVGETLAFDIAGTLFIAPVVNIRKVDWDSFRVNFFVVGSRVMLENQPASYISSFHLPADKSGFSTALARQFTNLTVIDVSAILAEVRSVLDRVLAAIEVVFAFSLLAGGAVLYAATLATHDERKHEAAILRTLGASRKMVKQAASAELLLVGGLAGFLAAIAALIIGLVASIQLFDMPASISWWLLPVGVLLGAMAARLAASPLLNRLLNTPPLRALR